MEEFAFSEMDQSVKRMLKLIEEDGDSLAKKAQMYYQKRPDLILLVEEFYRIYRSLAERYDHLTGELRKNIASDLQSQTSSISESAASELTSASGSPPPLALAAGSGSFDVSQKEADESSSSSDSETSESELDDSSITNHTDDLLAKVAAYEKELLIANEKIQLSQVEITRLLLEVQNYKSLEGVVSESSEGKVAKIQEAGVASPPLHQEPGLHDHDSVDAMESRSEEQVNNDDHLLLKEGSNSCKLQGRIGSLLVVLSERECKIRELEMALSDSKREALAEKAMFEAEITKYLEEQTCLKEQLKEEIDRSEGSIETLKSEKDRLQKEIDAVRVELSYRDAQVVKLEGHLHQLHMEHAILIANAEKANEVVAELEDEIERKKKVIADCWEEKREAIRQLCFSMEHYRSSYHRHRQQVGHGGADMTKLLLLKQQEVETKF